MPPLSSLAAVKSQHAFRKLVEPAAAGSPTWNEQALAPGATITGSAGNDYIGPNSSGGNPSTTFGNDVVRGLGGDDFIDGWLGNDRLDGGEGNDTLVSGEGSDTLNGGLGNDRLQLQVSVTPGQPDADIGCAYGGAGDDSIVAIEGTYPGGRGFSGSVDGGIGNDQLDIWALQRAGVVTSVLGGEGEDRLVVSVVAGPGKVIVDGGAGNDSLLVDCTDPFPVAGGAGSQTLVDGGTGDDSLVVRASNLPGSQIAVDAGEGHDTVSLSDINDGGVQVALGAGNDRLELHATNNIAVTGAGGVDTLFVANSVGVTLQAGLGNDMIFLDDTQATVSTGGGRDTLLAGSTAGGASLRTSTVLDFSAGDGGDRLDLSGVNALLGLPVGGDPFADGRARIEQGAQGAVLSLQLSDSPGEAWVALLVLKGVDVGSLTADNFVQAVDPLAMHAPAALSFDDLLDRGAGGELDLGALGYAATASTASTTARTAGDSASHAGTSLEALAWSGWATAAAQAMSFAAVD